MSDISVAIVEDDPRYRSGLELLLSSTPGWSVCGCYVRAETLLDEVGSIRPDLVLLDLDLPGMDGVETTRRLRAAYPDLVIVILTAFEDPPRIVAAIRAGIDGYLSKQAAGGELLTYLHTALTGQAALTPGVARSIMNQVRKTPRPNLDSKLTTREHQVLLGLVEGDSYKVIAANHGMSIDTVRTHVRHLYRKLRVNTATAAVGKAFRSGLVD